MPASSLHPSPIPATAPPPDTGRETVIPLHTEQDLAC